MHKLELHLLLDHSMHMVILHISRIIHKTSLNLSKNLLWIWWEWNAANTSRRFTDFSKGSCLTIICNNTTSSPAFVKLNLTNTDYFFLREITTSYRCPYRYPNPNPIEISEHTDYLKFKYNPTHWVGITIDSKSRPITQKTIQLGYRPTFWIDR